MRRLDITIVSVFSVCNVICATWFIYMLLLQFKVNDLEISNLDIKNKIKRCQNSNLSECGPSQYDEHGKCQIKFDGIENWIVDVCDETSNASGSATIYDLQKTYVENDRPIPYAVRLGYENGICDDGMYNLWKAKLDRD